MIMRDYQNSFAAVCIETFKQLKKHIVQFLVKALKGSSMSSKSEG